jgi:quercetin dioxygenase-like cupin family protein
VVLVRNLKSAMENKEAIRRKMLKEGFSLINEYDDSPNEIFPDHDHPGDQFLVVLKGSIVVTMEGKTSILRQGDEMFFPAKMIHSAQIGPEGCLYLDGERPVKMSKS